MIIAVYTIRLIPPQDHDRREFWRYMYRALAGHREKFLVAVMLAALGYHFRKVTEAYCR